MWCTTAWRPESGGREDVPRPGCNLDGVRRAVVYECRIGAKTPHENILQVAAIKEHPVVAGAGHQIEGVSVGLRERESEIQVIDEETLPVVAELGYHHQRNGLAGDQRIGHRSGAERHAEIPASDGYAIGGGSLAVICRPRSLHTRESEDDRKNTKNMVSHTSRDWGAYVTDAGGGLMIAEQTVTRC